MKVFCFLAINAGEYVPSGKKNPTCITLLLSTNSTCIALLLSTNSTCFTDTNSTETLNRNVNIEMIRKCFFVILVYTTVRNIIIILLTSNPKCILHFVRPSTIGISTLHVHSILLTRRQGNCI
jgi:hypothetical protein